MELIKIITERYPEYLELFAVFVLLCHGIIFLFKNSEWVKSILNIHYNKRILRLKKNNASLSDRIPKLTEALNHEINTLIFVSSFRYHLPPKMRSKFLGIHELAKDDWDLPSIKLLNANSSISEGVVLVSNTKATRYDFRSRNVLALLYFLAGTSLLVFTFSVTKFFSLTMLAFTIIAFTIQLTGVHIYRSTRQHGKDLKKMKSMYDGATIE